MNVEIFTICDAATADRGGKLNLLGVFDTIYTKSVPSILHHCTIAVRLRIDSDLDIGTHDLAITLRNPEDEDIIPPIEGRIDTTRADQMGASNTVFNIQGLKLPEYGNLSLQLLIGGKLTASVPLFVKPMPQSLPQENDTEGR